MTVLVDTSVWVEHLRGNDTPTRRHLLDLLRAGQVATTDVVIMEVLSGPTDDGGAQRLARMLAGARYLRQNAPEDAESAAALHRACRRAGETPRSRLDCLVAAVAVRHAVPVLHRDRDHDVLARHTDLRVVVL